MNTKSAFATALSLLLLCSLSVLAQSGRRVKKTSTPAPSPTPEASPTPTPTRKDAPAIPIVVGTNAFDSYGNIPFYFNESVSRGCAEGLQRSSAVNVEVQSRDMTRGDAVKRAKEAKEGYVVLLELRSDRMRTNNRNDLSQIYIEYSVFAAVTGKPVTSGSAYQQASSIRDVIVGRSDSSGLAERRLRNAARVAGERILGAIFARD